MKFRTELIPPSLPGFISYKSDMLAVGSCFADELGRRLQQLQFQIDVNPVGIIFNPVSMADLLNNSCDALLDETLFVQRDGNWYHYGYHSKLTASTKEELAAMIRDQHAQVKAKLTGGNRLLLTFGTAWVYRHRETNKVVANCHKIPQDQFTKELLGLDLLKKQYSLLIERLLKQNPQLEIVLTVSPVRHIKDGIPENNVSKSVLHLLTHFLVNQFGKVHYFPAYELIVDDLRDYRFYKEDLIHPSEQATDYVFEKFAHTFFNAETQKMVHLQQAILKLKQHQPMISGHSQTYQKIQELEREFLELKSR